MRATRIDYAATPWKQVREGKVKYKPIMMGDLGVSMVSFEPGAKEAPHSHEDRQIVFCLEGRVEFSVKDDDGERTEVLTPGITLALQPGVVHGAHATENSLLFVVWNPSHRFAADAILV